jgi:sulfopyruvate decarboxylase subunit beta
VPAETKGDRHRWRRLALDEPWQSYYNGALPTQKAGAPVFDNESLLSVGGFPTATSTGTDLEGIAHAAGVPKVATVRDVESFKAALIDAVHGNELTTIIAKVEAKGPAAYVTDLSLLENRFQFHRHIQSLKRG